MTDDHVFLNQPWPKQFIIVTKSSKTGQNYKTYALAHLSAVIV